MIVSFDQNTILAFVSSSLFFLKQIKLCLGIEEQPAAAGAGQRRAGAAAPAREIGQGPRASAILWEGWIVVGVGCVG